MPMVAFLNKLYMQKKSYESDLSNETKTSVVSIDGIKSRRGNCIVRLNLIDNFASISHAVVLGSARLVLSQQARFAAQNSCRRKR